MKVVVDTNIVFSALLNPASNIAKIILVPNTPLNFYSTNKLLEELNDHREKIIKLSGYTPDQLEKLISLLVRKIRFINIHLISKETYLKAEELTSDVDIDDCEFIALTEHLNGKLWSGDKKLIKGLHNKKWKRFINSGELYEISLNNK